MPVYTTIILATVWTEKGRDVCHKILGRRECLKRYFYGARTDVFAKIRTGAGSKSIGPYAEIKFKTIPKMYDCGVETDRLQIQCTEI